MRVRLLICIALLLAIVACAHHVSPSSGWRSADLYGMNVRMKYPVMLGPNASRLNPLIEHWIGDSCGKSPMLRHTIWQREKYRDARACVAALSRICAARTGGAGVSFTGSPPQCQAIITVNIGMYRAGLLSLQMQSYGSSYNHVIGTPYQSWDTEYLNLDTRAAHVLILGNLVNLSLPDATALEQAIIHALRAKFHIPVNQTLKQAGFDTNYPPIAKRVEVLPTGLMFFYNRYEVKFPVGARPRVMVPYSEISGLIPSTSPLRRLLRTSGTVR